MSERRPTLKDVSVLASVSIKTVSRVINNDPAVAAGTARRVQAIIEELGFRPDPVARSLRVGRDDAVGLIVENIADPFMSEVTCAVEEVARERGMFVVITSAGYAPENEQVAISGLANRRVAGLILTPTSGDHSYLAKERLRFPVVFVDRPPIQYDADTVVVDNEEGARVATAHLINHGHRRIAFVGDRLHVYTTRLRYQGFRAAMAKAGLSIDDRLVRVDAVGAENAAIAMTELLELTNGPPTAVLSANYRSSLGVVRALHQSGRTDLAHVSFDDFTGAESLSPPVTAIYQDPRRMGRQAASLLFDRIEGDTSPSRRMLLPVRLIVRGSGELPPPA
jgi:LacI family transcriptional regulator